MELTVRAGEPWRYGKLIGRYFVVVRNQIGKPTWTCEVTSPKRGHLCGRTRTWFSGPGDYRVTLQVHRGTAREDVATQAFAVDGSELGIEIALAFMSDNIEMPLRPAELHVIRLLPSIAGVLLEPTWAPSANSYPAYRLINQSSSKLYGVGWFGNYFGYLEQSVGSTWIRLERGGFCGTVDSGKPLAPGQATGSIEGHFIGRVQAFARGRYRYVLRYSTVSAQTGGVPGDIYQSGRTYSHSSDLHVIASPFEVPQS